VVTPAPAAPTVSAEEAGHKLKQAALQRMMGVVVDTKKEEAATTTIAAAAPVVIEPKAEEAKVEPAVAVEPPSNAEALKADATSIAASKAEPEKMPDPEPADRKTAESSATTNGTRNIHTDAVPKSDTETTTTSSRPEAPVKKKSLAALVKETPAAKPGATTTTKKKQRSTAFYSKTELLGYVVWWFVLFKHDNKSLWDGFNEHPVSFISQALLRSVFVLCPAG
jgi:hypothetical protein